VSLSCSLLHIYIDINENKKEPLPSNDRGYTYTHKMMGGIYEVGVEMGSGSIMFMPGFINIG
jgi:hypothetical protein